MFGNQRNRAAVAIWFDNQVHGHVELVLQADFAADFFHQVGLRDFNIKVHITTFGCVVYPRAKQDDLRAITQHSLGGSFDGVDLAVGQAHGLDDSFKVWAVLVLLDVAQWPSKPKASKANRGTHEHSIELAGC
jgi:hypothetical protein